MALSSSQSELSPAEWRMRFQSTRDAIVRACNDDESNLELARGVVMLASLRRAAPFETTWKQIASSDWTEALSVVDGFAEPQRSIFAVAAAARYLDHGNHSGFEKALSLLAACRKGAVVPPIAYDALCRCIEHRPALLAQLAVEGVVEYWAPLEILARRSSPEVVAEVFRSLEMANRDWRPEVSLDQVLRHQPRSEVALASIPHIQHQVEEIEDHPSRSRVYSPEKRRDDLHLCAASCLAKEGRIEEALTQLREVHGRRTRVENAIQILCDAHQPQRARLWLDEWPEGASRWLPVKRLANTFAEMGRVNEVLEVVGQLRGDPSEQEEILATALQGASLDELIALAAQLFTHHLSYISERARNILVASPTDPDIDCRSVITCVPANGGGNAATAAHLDELCRLLQTASIEVLRQNGLRFSEHLELAWFLTATLACRGAHRNGEQGEEFLALVPKVAQRSDIVN